MATAQPWENDPIVKSAEPWANDPIVASAQQSAPQESSRFDKWSDDMRRMRDEFGAIEENARRAGVEGKGPYSLPVIGPARVAVDTVGTGLGGLWSTVGHAAGGAADAVTYGLGSGIAALAGDRGGPLTDAVNTIGAGADAVGDGAKAFFLPPTTRQGLETIGRGWQSIPRDAQRTIGSAAEIVGTFMPIPKVGRSAAGIVGAPVAATGRALEESGLRGAERQAHSRAIEALRKVPTPTNIGEEALHGLEKGPFNQRTFNPPPAIEEMAKNLTEVMGDALRPGITNQGFIASAKAKLNEVENALQAALPEGVGYVRPERLAGNILSRGRRLLQNIPEEAFNSDAGKLLKKYVEQAVETASGFVRAAGNSPKELLRQRRLMDKWLESNKSTIFAQLETEGKVPPIIDQFRLSLRQAINDEVIAAAPSAATRKALDHESALMTAIERSRAKVSREPENALARMAEYLPDAIRPSGLQDFAKKIAKNPVGYTATVAPALLALKMGAGGLLASGAGLAGLGAYSAARYAASPGARRGFGALLQGRFPAKRGGFDYNIPQPAPEGLLGYTPPAPPPIYGQPPTPPPRLPPPSGPAPAGAYVVSPDGVARGVPQHEAVNMAAASRAQEAAYAKTGLTPDVRTANFRRAMREERDAAYDALDSAQKKEVEAQVEAMYRGQQVSVEEMVAQARAQAQYLESITGKKQKLGPLGQALFDAIPNNKK